MLQKRAFGRFIWPHGHIRNVVNVPDGVLTGGVLAGGVLTEGDAPGVGDNGASGFFSGFPACLLCPRRRVLTAKSTMTSSIRTATPPIIQTVGDMLASGDVTGGCVDLAGLFDGAGLVVVATSVLACCCA